MENQRKYVLKDDSAINKSMQCLSLNFGLVNSIQTSILRLQASLSYPIIYCISVIDTPISSCCWLFTNSMHAAQTNCLHISCQTCEL